MKGFFLCLSITLGWCLFWQFALTGLFIFCNWIKAFTTSTITRLRLRLSWAEHTRLSHRFAFCYIYISFSWMRHAENLFQCRPSFSMHMLIFSDRRACKWTARNYIHTNRSIWAEMCDYVRWLCVLMCWHCHIVATRRDLFAYYAHYLLDGFGLCALQYLLAVKFQLSASSSFWRVFFHNFNAKEWNQCTVHI